MRWGSVEEFEHADRTMIVKRPEGGSEHVDGPDLVLVHGIGVSSRYWARLATVLARSGNVHVVEMPGFGGAPRPPEPLPVEELAATVIAYARAAGLTRPVLVGHSMGVQVVLEAALQEPGLVAAVVGIGGVVDPAARSAPRQTLRLAHDMLREPPGANWAVLSDYLRTGPRWYLRTVPIMLGYRTEEALARVETPLLLLRGARDPIAGADWFDQMRRLAPRARAVEVESAAHVAMWSRPEAVAREVLEHARASLGREAA